MGIQMQYFRKSPRVRAYLALAFLLWAIFPHFQLLIHSHVGGEKGHFHTTLSKTDMENANLILQTLEGLENQKEEKSDSQNSEALAPPAHKNIFSGLSFSDKKPFSLHSHYFEEANVAGIGTYLDIITPPAIEPEYTATIYHAPPFLFHSLCQARAPPISHLV